MWNSQTVTLKSQNLSSNTGNVFETPKKFCVIHNIFSEVCKNFILNAQNNLRNPKHILLNTTPVKYNKYFVRYTKCPQRFKNRSLK